MGDGADPRRAAQARDRGQQPLDPALPLAWTRARAEPDLAHVPGESCTPPVGSGPVHGATLTFKTLYVLVFIAHGRRELVHVNVTANPTAAWVWRQLIEATPWAPSRGICCAIATACMAAIFGSALDDSASTPSPRPFERRVRTPLPNA